MADITVTAAYVGESSHADGVNVIRTRQCNVAVTKGQRVYYDTNGKVNLADANSTTGVARRGAGVALETKAAGEHVRVQEEGWVEGYTLTSQAYGAPLYESDTAGAFADAPSTTGGNTDVVGWVDWKSDNSKSKVIRLVPPTPAISTGSAKYAIVSLSGATIHAAANGIIDAWTNPEPGSVIISRVILSVTTVATGVCTLDIGTNATSVTTSDNLIDGVDVNTAIGTFDNTVSGGTNGKGGQILATGKFITLDEKTGDATGLVGKLIIEYIPL